jgi:methionyl-tRNA formyltransferase
VTTLRLAFAGTPDFAARHLIALMESAHELVAVLTQPDRPAGRGKQPRPSAVKTLAESAGLAVLQPPTLRSDDALAQLTALDLDVLVVVAYGLILPQRVLDLPRYGCLNVHGSLLPRWRGAAPIQRAIEAGDRKTGVTIMCMDAGLDTGPMLSQRHCPIAAQTTSTELYETLAGVGPQALLEVLNDLPQRLASARIQDEEGATYAKKIDKAEALLDWTEPASVLARRINAFNPAPGCFSFLDGKRIKIWRARPQSASRTALAGEISHVDENGITVSCGDGELVLDRVQLPGSRAMNTAELLRGHADLFAVSQHFSASRE